MMYGGGGRRAEWGPGVVIVESPDVWKAVEASPHGMVFTRRWVVPGLIAAGAGVALAAPAVCCGFLQQDSTGPVGIVAMLLGIACFFVTATTSLDGQNRQLRQSVHAFGLSWSRTHPQQDAQEVRLSSACVGQRSVWTVDVRFQPPLRVPLSIATEDAAEARRLAEALASILTVPVRGAGGELRAVAVAPVEVPSPSAEARRPSGTRVAVVHLPDLVRVSVRSAPPPARRGFLRAAVTLPLLGMVSLLTVWKEMWTSASALELCGYLLLLALLAALAAAHGWMLNRLATGAIAEEITVDAHEVQVVRAGTVTRVPAGEFRRVEDGKAATLVTATGPITLGHDLPPTDVHYLTCILVAATARLAQPPPPPAEPPRLPPA